MGVSSDVPHCITTIREAHGVNEGKKAGGDGHWAGQGEVHGKKRRGKDFQKKGPQEQHLGGLAKPMGDQTDRGVPDQTSKAIATVSRCEADSQRPYVPPGSHPDR